MNLANAEERQSQAPATFAIPSLERRSNIPSGHYAKVACAGERFWVTITGFKDGQYTGLVANNLINTREHGLKLNSVITFKPANIFDIDTPR